MRIFRAFNIEIGKNLILHTMIIGIGKAQIYNSWNFRLKMLLKMQSMIFFLQNNRIDSYYVCTFSGFGKTGFSKTCFGENWFGEMGPNLLGEVVSPLPTR